jgi:DNA-3-methyladenine glycosylase I
MPRTSADKARSLTKRKRCSWCGDDPLYQKYHDEEWGRPVHDDRKMFEMLLLEGFQAGLSWITVLRKRPAFRKAFYGFNPSRIAKMTRSDVTRLMKDEGIIRNRAKIEAAINNAKLFAEIQQEHGSFAKYIWQFSGGKTLRYPSGVRATSAESDAMSKALKKRGFKFVGSTICYAHMQATGMVDDHSPDCWLAQKKKRSQ